MKLPIAWLREWVAVPWNDRELADRLTMLGFEVEALAPVAPPFTKVCVAEITSVAPHPQAEKLRVCSVNAHPDVGPGVGSTLLQIVCGASNARAGLRTALAMVGAKLPGNLTIGAATLRGVESQGMLCSARELGLAEAGEGILELEADAAIGTDVRDYLDLDGMTMEVGVTPNRGDAMSVLGIARELAAASGLPLNPPASLTTHSLACAPSASVERFPVHLTPGAGGARFASQVIRGLDNRRPTPTWLRQRLERSGLRSISPIVDVTNFVLLELGQPMHAYDLAKVQGGLTVRLAREGEPLTLLDGRDIALNKDVLVIADEAGPVGMAGVMGSARSAITTGTTEVVLEVAWFDPKALAGRGRRFGLHTDAGQRFERGVDPRGQERALERASNLICAIAGGRPDLPVVDELPLELPVRAAITLRAHQITRLLGLSVPSEHVLERLHGLGMKVEAIDEIETMNKARPVRDPFETLDGRRWRVTPPSWRFDIVIEADLIEELARCGGLEAIAEMPHRSAQVIAGCSELRSSERSVLNTLTARGYTEVVTFGFTDPVLQAKLCGNAPPISLRNPIASNLSVLRASLWPGLVLVAQENVRRQCERLRLFEIATCFALGADQRATNPGIQERRHIAGLVLGARSPEQWGTPKEPTDFYDLKADVSAVLQLTGAANNFLYEAGTSVPSLHPGRSAQIRHEDRVVGQIGELHPALVREFDFTYPPVLFELDYAAIIANARIRLTPISSFPQIRRDISIEVATDLPFGRIAERVSVAAGPRLHELRLFDIYQGSSVESGRKSVAFGLILQDLSRTLQDTEADEIVAQVGAELRSSFGAKIRE